MAEASDSGAPESPTAAAAGEARARTEASAEAAEAAHGDETPPPPVEPEGHNLEPLVLALVFLVPPIVLGGSAIALAFAKNLAWNPLAVGLVIGLVVSVAFYFVVRRIFAQA